MPEGAPSAWWMVSIGCLFKENLLRDRLQSEESEPFAFKSKHLHAKIAGLVENIIRSSLQLLHNRAVQRAASVTVAVAKMRALRNLLLVVALLHLQLRCAHSGKQSTS